MNMLRLKPVGTVLMMLFLAFPALANGNAREPHAPPRGWPHTGLYGTFDRNALQRGYQVYKQVCATCHSMNLLSFRNLADLGFKPEEIKALAAEYKVADGPNDQGEMYERPGRPSDAFPKPFPNEQAARAANNGALPPDLSLIVKARNGHENYIYSLLTGFVKPPEGEHVAEGMQFNPYFPGHQIAMPPPLADDSVTYSDGTKASLEQEAYDVSQFLAWASEPHLEARKQTGLKVLIFLAVFTGIMIAVKKKIWSRVH